jgi:hypothetical protein
MVTGVSEEHGASVFKAHLVEEELASEDGGIILGDVCYCSYASK